MGAGRRGGGEGREEEETMSCGCRRQESRRWVRVESVGRGNANARAGNANAPRRERAAPRGAAPSLRGAVPRRARKVRTRFRAAQGWRARGAAQRGECSATRATEREN